MDLFKNKHHLKYNWIGYTAGVIAIGGLIAQIEVVYQRKSAKDLSYILVISRVLILVLWLWYGVKNKLPPTLFASITGLILTFILLGFKIHYDITEKSNTKSTITKNTNSLFNNGSKYWFVMHTYSYNYPVNPTENDKNTATEYYNSMFDILPCNMCRTHSIEYIKDNPITVNSREELIEWVLNFHNSINKKLHRDMWTREQLNDKYSN